MLSRNPNAVSTSQTVSGWRAYLIGCWLWCVAALVFAMVLVGGATRLTESGLSIVEWQPVTGTIPPLSAAAWQTEFDKYKLIPQYQRVNRGMSLDDFKTIYWWEWGHRLLGRVIGVVLLVPLVWFWWRGWMDRRLGSALAGIFALGAVQGAVGWWMVASGLSERVNVSQYRLAFHLTLACIIYAALVWTADRVLSRARGVAGFGLAANPAGAIAGTETVVPSCGLAPAKGSAGVPGRTSAPAGARSLAFGACALLALVLAQIYLGALVAGLRAGLIYNTWPLIDGHIIPPASGLFFGQPWWRNFFENTLTVQFDHRMVAYALCTFALIHVANVWRRDPAGSLTNSAGFVLIAILAQALIGIITLLHAAPMALAMIHQAMGLIVLTAATIHAARAVLPDIDASVAAGQSA
jgi:heme a synthase